MGLAKSCAHADTLRDAVCNTTMPCSHPASLTRMRVGTLCHAVVSRKVHLCSVGGGLVDGVQFRIKATLFQDRTHGVPHSYEGLLMLGFKEVVCFASCSCITDW